MLQRLRFSLWLLNNGIAIGSSVLLDFHKRVEYDTLKNELITREGLAHLEKATVLNRIICFFISSMLGPYLCVLLIARIRGINEIHSLSFEGFPFFYKLRNRIKIVEYQHGLSNVVKYREKVLEGVCPTERIVDTFTLNMIQDEFTFKVSSRKYLDMYTIGHNFDYKKNFEDFNHFVWIDGGLDNGNRLEDFRELCEFILHRPGMRRKDSFDWEDLDALNRDMYCVVGFFTTGLSRSAKMGFHSFRLKDKSNPYDQSIPGIIDV